MATYKPFVLLVSIALAVGSLYALASVSTLRSPGVDTGSLPVTDLPGITVTAHVHGGAAPSTPSHSERAGGAPDLTSSPTLRMPYYSFAPTVMKS